MPVITVELCAGTACHVMGAHALNVLLKKMAPQLRKTIKVKMVQCLGNCGQGPNVRIEGTLYSRVTTERLLELIKHHISQE